MKNKSIASLFVDVRQAHRFSKDIDIFIPDPQSLGFATPRLSDIAESITTDCDARIAECWTS